jgi:hypothetical protein
MQEPPPFPPPGAAPPPGSYADVPRSSGPVKQVKVVAILMIVQGSLECVMGLLCVFIGPFTYAILTEAQKQSPAPQMPPGVLSAIYVALGALMLALGIFRIVSGVRNLKYRGRVLGIVALAAGVLSVFTCYCAPSAIGLLIYGLIIYLNDDVRRAFEQGEQGATPDQIKASFG